MLSATHRFTVELLDPSGAIVSRRTASGHLPIHEDIRFLAVRRGLLANDGSSPPGRLEPLWRGGRVAGLLASLAGVEKQYPLDVFKHDALQMIAACNNLQAERETKITYRWQVSAEATSAAASRLRMAIRRRPFPIDDPAPAVLPPEPADRSPLPLFVTASVLEELRRETARSLHVERADILTGSLVRSGDVLSLVVRGRRALAAGTTASAAHVAFSPETFAAAQQQHLRAGGAQEICGWHHNHPPRCGRDCLLVVPACQNDSVFLSIADAAVFHASFAAPYMVGLISGKGANRRADDPIVCAWGWHDGLLQEIPYTVLEE